MTSRRPRVSLVGAGPGDPGLLTLRALRAIETADVLLYDALVGDGVLAMASPRCERIYVGKRGNDHAMAQTAIEAVMIAQASAGRYVVRLKGGDPFVFGRGGEEAHALRAAGLDFEVVPGISSALAAPAYAGIPLTHRAFNAAFTVASGREDPAKPASRLDWDKLADEHRTLVFLMAAGNLSEITHRLISHGLPESTPVAVVQDGTRPSQRTCVSTLQTIAADAERAGIGAPAVVVVGNVVALRDDLAWFDRLPLFGKRVLVTRPAAQSADFARNLALRGAEPVLAPVIAVEPPSDPLAAHRSIDELDSYDWVVFTSANGVDAFFERLAALDADARYLNGRRVAAIGAMTGLRLQRFGVRADLIPADFVSEEIARALIEAAHSGDRVLVYRAEEARDILPQMLNDAGLEATVVAAYRTATVHDPLFAEKVESADILTFTSASTARGFAENYDNPERAAAAARGKSVACIGPITAAAAGAIGIAADVVATTFTTDGLIAALEAHFSPP